MPREHLQQGIDRNSAGQTEIGIFLLTTTMKKIFIPLLIALSLSACSIQRADLPASFLGGPMPSEEADRTIEIFPHTKWVNVTGGEIIRFVMDGKDFGWTFDAAYGPSSYDLRRIAPEGFVDRPITVYVAPDPRNGGDDSELAN